MKKADKNAKWKLAGLCTVDAGIIHIGDPCYLLQKDEPQKWDEYCDELETHKNTTQLNHKSGPGLGVVVSSGLGDGVYKVYTREIDLKSAGKRVAEAKIVFLDDKFIKSWNK